MCVYIYINRIRDFDVQVTVHRDKFFRPDPARKLSSNLYDTYHCCVYSEKLLMMDRRTVRNMQFHSKKKSEKLVHLVGFIIGTYTGHV